MAGGHERSTAALALQAPHHGGRIGGHQLRIVRIAFVGSSPAYVARHRHGRRESPVDADGGHFLCGGLADALDELDVVSRTETDVVRKNGRTNDLGITVNRVDAEKDRDRRVSARAAFELRPVQRVDQVEPGSRGGAHIAPGSGSAARKYRTELVGT